MSLEDQQKINLFARNNVRLSDIKEQITEKEVREARKSWHSPQLVCVCVCACMMCTNGWSTHRFVTA